MREFCNSHDWATSFTTVGIFVILISQPAASQMLANFTDSTNETSTPPLVPSEPGSEVSINAAAQIYGMVFAALGLLATLLGIVVAYRETRRRHRISGHFEATHELGGLRRVHSCKGTTNRVVEEVLTCMQLRVGASLPLLLHRLDQ